MVAQAAKEFAEKYVRPHVMDWDESQEFPIEVFRKAGDLGFMGVLVPEIIWWFRLRLSRLHRYSRRNF